MSFTFPCCSCHVAYINLFCLPPPPPPPPPLSLSLTHTHTHALKLLLINTEPPPPPFHTHSRCAVIFVHWVRSSLLEKQGTCKCAILDSPKRHGTNLHVLPFSNTTSSPSLAPLSLSLNRTYHHCEVIAFLLSSLLLSHVNSVPNSHHDSCCCWKECEGYQCYTVISIKERLVTVLSYYEQ